MTHSHWESGGEERNTASNSKKANDLQLPAHHGRMHRTRHRWDTNAASELGKGGQNKRRVKVRVGRGQGKQRVQVMMLVD